MKNFKKLIALVACAALVAPLTGCGAKAKYAKVGFGTEVSVQTNEDGTVKQVDTTMATVGLDADGKIAYLDIDTAQSKTEKFDERTKDELKEDYGMVAFGGATKEWYEQVDFLEEFAIGKTPEEFANIETYDKGDGHHTDVPAEGSDLAAGCTIDIGSFKAVVAEAVANAVEVEAEKIGAGEVTTYGESHGKWQVNTDMASVALDKDGKVAWANFDTAQSLNGKDETKTKVELKEDYGMKAFGGSVGELYEELAHYAKTLVGKTADEAKALSTEDADLAAGCTISINGYQAALAEALESAK